jgi:hypothetical protein
MILPRARRDDLLTTELDDEVVVYDPNRKQAHCLNKIAVAVWRRSDGSNSLSDLQRLVSQDVGAPVGKGGISLALRKLERAHLLVYGVEGDDLTRRQMLGKASRLAGATLAVPIVVSALVPTAAAAASTRGDHEPVSDERDDPHGPDRD